MPALSPLAARRRGPTRAVLAAAVVALLTLLPAAGAAQDGEEGTEPTPVGAEPIVPIVSTLTGEVPSFGARRPGPVDLAPADAVREEGVAPRSLRIDPAAVEAGIERSRVVDGAMPDPTGPWVVAWYENLGALGEGGNVVMAGHIDYWNVGPAVFYDLAGLEPGDRIAVTGEDERVYDYEVEWVRQYDAETAPLDELVGPTPSESLTLITCGGTFDFTTARYLQRTVVRANRVAASAAA